MGDIETFKYVGQRIREFRTSYGGTGISQDALAKALKVASNTVSRWETATYRPTLEDLTRLAKFFGKRTTEFFPDSEQPAESDPRFENLRVKLKLLSDKDIETLNKYADFLHAQEIYERRTPGRKAKK
jgi:transcriptional regulator with XRE-family HTH domain